MLLLNEWKLHSIKPQKKLDFFNIKSEYGRETR